MANLQVKSRKYPTNICSASYGASTSPHQAFHQGTSRSSSDCCLPGARRTAIASQPPGTIALGTTAAAPLARPPLRRGPKAGHSMSVRPSRAAKELYHHQKTHGKRHGGAIWSHMRSLPPATARSLVRVSVVGRPRLGSAALRRSPGMCQGLNPSMSRLEGLNIAGQGYCQASALHVHG